MIRNSSAWASVYVLMCSDGTGIKNRIGKRFKFATSQDGSSCSKPRFLTPVPPDPGPDSPHYGTPSESPASDSLTAGLLSPPR